MTTPAAENFYLAQHLLEMDGKPYAIYNPENKPVESLPVIFGFNNGGGPGWFEAVALAEDGTCLGGHTCSHEGYMLHDLGVLEGTREDRHKEQYQVHYPHGYRMAFVPSNELETCEALNAAIKRAEEKAKAQEPKPLPEIKPTATQLAKLEPAAEPAVRFEGKAPE